MNLTPAQIIALSISTLSVLAGATAQLTTLFGQVIAQDITTACSLIAAILGGWIAVVTGQSAMVKQVAALPGVERISVNAQANSTLAAVATDPGQVKIGATTPETRSVLLDTAKGA